MRYTTYAYVRPMGYQCHIDFHEPENSSNNTHTHTHTSMGLHQSPGPPQRTLDIILQSGDPGHEAPISSIRSRAEEPRETLTTDCSSSAGRVRDSRARQARINLVVRPLLGSQLRRNTLEPRAPFPPGPPKMQPARHTTVIPKSPSCHPSQRRTLAARFSTVAICRALLHYESEGGGKKAWRGGEGGRYEMMCSMHSVVMKPALPAQKGNQPDMNASRMCSQTAWCTSIRSRHRTATLTHRPQEHVVFRDLVGPCRYERLSAPSTWWGELNFSRSRWAPGIRIQ